MSNEAIRTLIVEDTAADREFLADMLREHFHKRVEIVGEASNLEEAESLFRKKRPALLLLDVEMEGDSTTFDLLDRLEKANELEQTGVIFLTASARDGYRKQAIDHAALHFLEKPVKREELDDALERFEKNSYARTVSSEQLKIFMLQQQNMRPPSRLALPLLKGVLEMVDIADIIYLEADGEITHFHLVDERHLKAMKHLGYFEETLEAHTRFERVSRSTIVNVEHIIRFDPGERMLTMRDQTPISVSRRKASDFRSTLEQFHRPLHKRLLGKFKGLFGG